MGAGETVEAKATVTSLLKVNPTFSIKDVAFSRPYKYARDRDRFLNALREAGLPED